MMLESIDLARKLKKFFSKDKTVRLERIETSTLSGFPDLLFSFIAEEINCFIELKVTKNTIKSSGFCCLTELQRHGLFTRPKSFLFVLHENNKSKILRMYDGRQFKKENSEIVFEEIIFNLNCTDKIKRFLLDYKK